MTTHRRRAALRGAPLATLLAFAGCGEPSATIGTRASAISGGAADSVHTNVVGIAILGGSGVATCTGSLLTPTVVLTARHCVSPVAGDGIACQQYTDSMGVVHPITRAQAPYAARSFLVTTAQMMGRSSPWVGVAQVVIPPNSTGAPLCGRDIAILRLESPITDVPPIAPRLDAAPLAGETFTAVGYGATSGSGGGAGQRRFRDGLTVQWVGEYRARERLATTEAEFIADEGTCQGDSGGPPIDGLGHVFGVLSRGAAGMCVSQVYTRVDAHAAWIRDAVRAASEQAGTDLPAWIDPPEPGSAGFGEDCRGDTQCAEPYQCLAQGERRRCLDIDCDHCPSGWICGDVQGGRACVPDPSAPPPPPDAGSGADAGADGGGGGGTGSMGGGCAAGPQRRGRGAGVAFAGLALALGVVAARRRRRR